jgi:RNA polymerase sigma-70 factor (ECF subfamily)
MTPPLPVADATRFSDDELVRWILAGETGLFELLMRRYNQRLYRAARAILRDDAEAEDVTQDAWVRAYQHLRQFEGRASFSTWLTRIGVHEALSRLRRRSRKEEIDGMTESRRDSLDSILTSASTPEQLASNNEARNLLEQAIDSLPDAYRETFVLRDVEGMSTAETAESLSISEENVKTRLHRARALLRKELYARAGATSSTAFHFLGVRCDRMVAAVMTRIQVLPGRNVVASSLAEPS